MTECNKTLVFLFIGAPKLFDRVKQILRKLASLVYTTLINLNIFPVRTFGSNMDRLKAKQLGQWASRLYVILLIICFAILSLYTVIQPQILTKTFNKPSLSIYNQLILDHNDTLQCPCSSISSTYNQFISIEPMFHQASSGDYSNSFMIRI
jgi:hypothetical protein